MVNWSRRKFIVILLGLILLVSLAGIGADTLTFGRIPPRSVTSAVMHTLKRRILRYARVHDRLPAELKDVPWMPFNLGGIRLVDGWGNPIVYLVDPKSCTVTLISYGRDGKPGGQGENHDTEAVFSAKDKNGRWQDELCPWIKQPYWEILGNWPADQ